MAEEAVVKKEREKKWYGPEGTRNTTGRPKADPDAPKVTRRSVRDKELMQLARKLRPHVSSAIGETVKILQNSGAADTNKLKAAAWLVGEYRKLITDIYEGEDTDESVSEMQPQNTPTFSLHVLKQEES